MGVSPNHKRCLSFMECHHFLKHLQNCFIWHLGDGRSIQLFEDPWLFEVPLNKSATLVSPHIT